MASCFCILGHFFFYYGLHAWDTLVLCYSSLCDFVNTSKPTSLGAMKLEEFWPGINHEVVFWVINGNFRIIYICIHEQNILDIFNIYKNNKHFINIKFKLLQYIHNEILALLGFSKSMYNKKLSKTLMVAQTIS